MSAAHMSDGQFHATLALGALIAFFVVIVASRVLVQARRTGEHGLRFFQMKIPSVAFFCDLQWVITTVTFCSAVVLAWQGDSLPLTTPPPAPVGAAIAAIGIALGFGAQLAMGASWRIGLKPGEVTALVERGPFALVRNPIYTCVMVFLVGLSLLIPTAPMLVGLALAVIGIELQVRVVEEPHLVRVHGATYRAYAQRVGRFVPFVGRWS